MTGCVRLAAACAAIAALHAAHGATGDLLVLLGGAGISWNIWNWGFGMCNPNVADYIRASWRDVR